MMCTIGRNGESKLKQKLPTPASRDNGIRMNVLVERKIGEVFHCWDFGSLEGVQETAITMILITDIATGFL